MDVGSFGFTIAGLVVGFIVGMTGVGGGSLMTPILLWFGINPATAVGTDLLYAAITKASGVWVHARQKNIDGVPANGARAFAFNVGLEDMMRFVSVVLGSIGAQR